MNFEVNSLHNLNIERSIISTILFDPNKMGEIKNEISIDTFYFPPHQRLYGTIEQLYKEDKILDESYIMERHKRLHSNNFECDSEAMLEILATNPLPNVKAYLLELEEKKQRRILVATASLLHKKIIEGENVDATKLWLIDVIEKMQRTSGTNAKSFNLCVQEDRAAPPVELIYTSVSFIDVPLSFRDGESESERKGGFEEGRFVLIMGDPEAGKTMLAVQMMKSISKSEIVLFFAFEFTVRNFVRTQMRIEGADYQNENLQIIDKGYDISDIVRELHYWRKKGCRVAFIDSQMRVENVSMTKATSEERESSKFSTLAKTAQKLGMVIAFICQQGKEDTRGGVITPQGSKKGGHEADILVYLKKQKDSEDRQITFVKNKQTGKHFVADIAFEAQRLEFKRIYKQDEKGKGDKVPLSDTEKAPPKKATVCYPNGQQSTIDL